ncbi:MAG TPA: NAD(P)/FAD-dependent oxidoreductase [Firmicutes bacterium]|nr:NAD(P)/FAD-dependent oxidoreductase [Bacillota bacterium]
MGERTQYDVVVIGGGVVGTAVLRTLSRYQLKAALLEKEAEVGWGATKANSGIVHAGFHNKPGSWMARLCVAGNRMYDQLCDELDVPFQRNGLMMVARTPEEEQILRRFYQQGLDNGVPGMELLDGDTARRLEPNLSGEITMVLRAASGGIVAPFALAHAQAENAAANGADVYTEVAVTGISCGDDGFTITSQDGGTWKAKYIVNAAGLFADDVARMCGLDVPSLIPRKGEEYILDQRVGDLVKHTIFPVPTPKSKGILVIPTVGGNIMIGPTALEMPRKDDLSTTAAGLDEILAFTQRLVPKIQRRDIIAAFAGLRAGSPTGDFIFETSHSGRAVHLLGIESPGLTASPAIAEHVAEMLAEAGLELMPKPDFNPRRPRVIRFKKLSDEEKEEVIKRDPLYAHVVCRCETVTEGEIVDAVRRGARTVDGVKFLTRAGMGRCQGGFCTPYVVRILARELGVSPLEITKRGRNTELLAAEAKAFLKGGEADA